MLARNYENRPKRKRWSTWDPDPPPDFEKWWNAHGSDAREIGPKVAWNVARYRNEYEQRA